MSNQTTERLGKKSSSVILKDVTKIFQQPDTGKDFVAVDHINLHIQDGEMVTLLGPSGCGKTTTLRMIAGFEMPTSGQIIFDGEDITNLPPHLRRVNTVFQKYALFPHLNVFNNIAFGLKMKLIPNGTKRNRKGEEVQLYRKYTKAEIKAKVDAALKMVDLEDYGHRGVSSLSGGQQQRIAIARAIVNEPDILLLDEPLGALDLKMRQEMQLELKSMHEQLGITFIYVTHDQEEALTLSDRIAVFNKGFIEQIGTPNEVYNHSRTEFVCNFIGDINRLEGEVADGMKLDPAQHHFVRLERIRVNRPADDNELRLDGVIESREYYGLYIKYYIHVGSQTIKAIEKNDGINIYEPGEKVTVGIHPVDVMSYDAAPDAR